MHEVQPDGRLADLFAIFKEVGGVIDYVLIEGIHSEQDSTSYTLHREGAILTVEAACTRYPRSQDKGPASRREPDNIQGEQVSSSDFFAPGYVWIPIDEISTSPYLTEEQRAYEPTDPNVRLHRGLGYGFANYHHAFRYTPYGLVRYGEDAQKFTRQEAEQLFADINHELFGDERNALTIYTWSTDWADYFNEGHVWWGSFLWTVYSPQTRKFVGIAASTDD